MVLFADTNILLDLNKVKLFKEFFTLSNSICIEESIFYDELLEPKGIQEELLACGLLCVSMNNEEFLLARKVYEEKPKLSFYDCVAFAVAKLRGWELMTGDKRLRRYAELHQVKVHGLLWAIGECEKEEVDRATILKAIHIIMSDSRIRIPKRSTMMLCMSILLKQYRGERAQMDYCVSFNVCT